MGRLPGRSIVRLGELPIEADSLDGCLRSVTAGHRDYSPAFPEPSELDLTPS